ncbi:hypothetical protein [Fundicoccus culcitae]|uniref:O-antigen ligase like membrane protein n=1 Tax=Fundicoccus culcitae TaxID=2969821 RepID=A0ABY5P916_9LACT|nr:hypothetical protein [Fundicoccus culcitae]UUX35241.1 hypothetical protein NRE15_06250 [Fundicoccus culcitae]
MYININQEIFYHDLRKFLIAYICFIFILATIYFFSPAAYFNIRSFWTLSDNVTLTDSLLISRFTGTLSDPNNQATVINAVLIFLFVNYKEKNFISFILLLMSGFICVTTLSLTGILIYAITVIIYVISLSSKFINNFTNIKVNIFALLLVIIIVIPSSFFSLEKLINSNLFETFVYRFSINSADSRFSRWEIVLENKNFFAALFFGDGGTMIINGGSFRPHNGHFHLIFNYGFIAYLIFMWLFFRIRTNFRNIKYYLFMIPFFIGFTVNVGIIDFRFYTILALLTANYYPTFKKKQNYSSNDKY